MTKRVVVWGTGFVGKLVIPEILPHPGFELVGVGVSNPDWPRGGQDDVYRVEIEGTPSITQETAFRFTDGSGRDAATAGCLATGLRALNAVPTVNDLPPGWVTALDLPLIPGAGTIR
jgi:hypothetical protein